uniref:Uncharacterized protein n=1 Tax=Cacopsylla melanoneura TaxID=428564 RepID=A0A8D8R7V1_9HEMI
MNLYSPIALLTIFVGTIGVALILYQIMLFDPALSVIRLLKLIAEVGTVLVASFFIANMSELLDDCNGRMRTALADCSWINCACATQRDICILLRRVQRAQYLTFYGGLIVVTRMHYMNGIKLAYSFVNYMRVLYKPK